MNKDNILLSSLSVNNITQKELSATTSVDLIKRDDFDKLVSEMEVYFTDTEQNKIFSIIEDRYITDEEIESLTYEQVKKLKNLIIEKDANGNVYDASLIRNNYRVNGFLSTSLISDNEDFNKAIFEKMKTLDEKDNLLLMGAISLQSYFSWAAENDDTNPNFVQIKEKDMEKYLKDKIRYFKNALDESPTDLASKTYKQVLSWYEDIYENYASIKKEREDKVAQIMRNNRPNPLEILG